MSALWQMLASLWAAAWLRGRLLAIGARRRFGGQAGTGTGTDYYLTAAETPVEGVDYDPKELLPAALVAGLDATRAELRDHARRASTPTTRRRGAGRRRTASVVTAGLLAFAVLGAGATALVTGTTGVSAIDRLLGYNAAQRDGETGDGAASRPPSATVTPQPGTSNMVLEVPFEVGGEAREVVGASYRSKAGGLCLATTTDVDSSKPRGSGGCLSLPALQRQLADRDVVVAGTNTGETLVMSGYTSTDVERLEIEAPVGGELTVRLSEPWRPDGPGTEALRSFLAVAPDGSALAGLDADEAMKVMDPRGYRIRAQLSDGTERDVTGSP